MDSLEYEYDVAFSFLARDEPLAAQINDLLKVRLKTFLYSERQTEIAGTNGEETFGAVFGKKARIVVVLYRAGWGEETWTRIEATAIRNRGFERGYAFAFFIPLDDPRRVPDWLPRAQVWFGLERWKVEGAASAIEARAQEMGGEPHQETAIEHAIRLDKQLKFEADRKRFLNSIEGVKAAGEKFTLLRRRLEDLVAEIDESASSISMTSKFAGRELVVLGFGIGLKVEWCQFTSNSLDNAKLVVEIWKGHPAMVGVHPYEQPQRLRTMMELRFDLLPSNESCWRGSGNSARAFNNKDLASLIMKEFMDEGKRALARLGVSQGI